MTETVESIVNCKNVSVYYGQKKAINNISIDIERRSITAFIGPSGCGKSTFLRTINRMNDTIDSCRIEGTVIVDGKDIYDPSIDVVPLRAKGWNGISKPNPFPKSIYENVAYGPRIHGLASNKSELDDIVEKALKGAGLWNEARDRLDESGTSLSGGQQQRLCIARTIAVEPQIILMDEPCSALDPIATSNIEDLMSDLAKEYTIIIVTHSMQQAARVSQKTAYFHLGNLIEYGDTKEIFVRPKDSQTEAYISGKIG